MPDDNSDDLIYEISEMLAEDKRRAEQVRIPQLIQAGLIRPPMTLEADYTPDKDNPAGETHQLEATIQRDGSLRVKDGVYQSVSMAASMAIQPFLTKPQSNQKPQVNGWVFWSFRDPNTGRLWELNELRYEYGRKAARK